MTENKHNAVELLKADHREAEKLFEQFESIKDSGNEEEKREIIRKVCAALLIHMQIEEAIFYPAARDALDEEELIDEAEVEYKGAKDLIRQLGETNGDIAMFDARAKVLSEQIRHHIREEENKLFPKLQRSPADLTDLGKRLLKEKRKLEQSHSMASA